MRRVLTTIAAASLALGMMAPTAFYTAGYLNSPMVYKYRGGNRQTFQALATGKRSRRRR